MPKTIISEELTVTGDIKGESSIEIRGKVIGDIDIRSMDILAGGSVEGNVRVETAQVRGSLKGSITAQSLDLYAQADVHAEISAKAMAAEKGARFVGAVKISGDH
jgi:cytoskeletal protein CcmA (bactofilin family)